MPEWLQIKKENPRKEGHKEEALHLCISPGLISELQPRRNPELEV